MIEDRKDARKPASSLELRASAPGTRTTCAGGDVPRASTIVGGRPQIGRGRVWVAVAAIATLAIGVAGTAAAQPRKPKPGAGAGAGTGAGTAAGTGTGTGSGSGSAAPAPKPDGADKVEPTAPAGAAAGRGKPKVFDFTGLDLAGRLRTPQLLYFLDRASEELERASLERRSFVPAMVRSIDESAL